MLSNLKKLPYFLAGIFLLFWLLLAIHPYSRDVWIAENLPIVIIFLILVFTYKKFQFSNTAYFLMAIWLFWHTVGGHYTFERVPFGFITDLFHFERNHFDRIGHFSIGFYAYPIVEFLERRKLITSKLTLFCFGLFVIMSVAAAYEIIEWWYAAAEGGEAGAAFLGSQGDIWDAQKDMLADTLGAIFALGIYFSLRRKSKD